ncbi:hypothetical protein ACFLZG_02530 [Thermodesulfobacteriota bacterium]
MGGIGITVICIIVAFIIIMKVPPYMTSRAIQQVIMRFRQHRALDEESAKTLIELGLGPRPFIQRLTRLKDYTPRALKALQSAGIVRITADSRFFMSEERLQASNIETLKTHIGP